MSDHDLQTMLREAEPARQHAPGDIDALWATGRRRLRRSRSAWAAGAVAIVLLVVGTAITVSGTRDEASVVDMAGPAPVTELPVDTELVPAMTEPGPDVPDQAADGFSLKVLMNHTDFYAGGDGAAEIRLIPSAENPVPVTVAVPFTIDTWDPGTGTWTPQVDLYDMSRNPSAASWQPHGTGRAWYERTTNAWGFPVLLPTQDLAPGSYRVCVQAWPSADDPADPAGNGSATVFGDAVDLPSLAIPGSAERLCVPISLAGPGSVPSEADYATAPQLQIDGLAGVHALILPATAENLSVAVGLLDGTPRPGDPGIAVIIGHRTTWTAPFRDLDRLRPGDRYAIIEAHRRIDLEVVATRIVTAEGPVEAPTFGIPASELAQPSPDDDPAPLVRLVTFNPTYSAAERLIVDAVVISSSGEGG